MREFLLAAAAVLAIGAPAKALPDSEEDTAASLSADYEEHLRALYEHLHANPELSFVEHETAARLAEEFHASGFDVEAGVGGTGVVALMENGDGPTVMLRSDMDALPMRERTDLDFASEIVMEDRNGDRFPVMHACAHDTHMTALVGAARWFADNRDAWSGRLMLVAQPAEEIGLGAAAMLEDGLYDRFATPDAVLGFHAFGGVPAGEIRYASGYAMASVDTVDLYVHGIGAHGASPHLGRDPVVLGSQIVLNLQTLVSREISPFEPAVVTVGAFNAGTKHNIISDEAHLQLTVRSYGDETRETLLSGIERIARGQAAAAGLEGDMAPRMEIADGFIPALYNDPALTSQAVAALEARFGDRVEESRPTTTGEDFSFYGRTDADVPVFMFWVGASPAAQLAEARETGGSPPSNHSPYFAPDPAPTITTGAEGLITIARDIFENGVAAPDD